MIENVILKHNLAALVCAREGEKDGHRMTEKWVEALLSRCVNVIRGGNGGRKVGRVGGDLLQQRYLPNAWSRNTNTAPVMTETEGPRKTEKKMFGGERLFQQMFRLIKIWLHKQQEREADLWLNHKCFNNPKFPHSDQIPLNQQWLSFTPVQLIGLILASVSLKAECICPTATPKGRKDNTSKPAAQLLADFKEILWDYVPLRCLSPVTAKVTRVTLTVVLFMLLDFLLLKLFGALLFAPHLLTTNTRINGKHTHGLTNKHKWWNMSICVQARINTWKVKAYWKEQVHYSTISWKTIWLSIFYSYVIVNSSHDKTKTNNVLVCLPILPHPVCDSQPQDHLLLITLNLSKKYIFSHLKKKGLVIS